MRTQTTDCTSLQARLTSGLLSQARALEMLAALATRGALANLLTGIAVGLLTWMSGWVTLDLAIVVAAPVAAQTTFALFRRS